MKISEQPRITLAKVKYAAFASEETLCFSATILLDGKPVADVRNDGHGGADRVTVTDEAGIRSVDAFIATLEPMDVQGYVLKPSLELVVGDLMERWLVERDFDRALKTKWLYTTPGNGLVYYVPKAKVTNPDLWAKEYERHHRFEPKFLHRLPRAEALEIYRRARA